MSYIANWNTFEINQTPADQSSQLAQAQSILYWLKTQLLVVGWTVVSSSNAAVSGATDLWTSASALNWQYYQSSRSWIVLKSPVGFVAGPNGLGNGNQSRMYLCLECFQYSNNGINQLPYNFNVWTYSSLPTGGSTSNVPMSSDAQSAMSYTSAAQWLPNPLIASRMHFASTSNGGFYFCLSGNGTGIMYSLLYFLPLVEVNNYGSLPYPYAAISGFYYGYGVTNFGSNIFDAGIDAGVKGWNYDGTPGYPKCMFLNNAQAMVGSNTTETGDINGNLIFSPILIYNYAPGYTFLIGQVPDFYFNGTISYGNGSTAPVASVSYCAISNTWLPTNTAFSL